MNAGQPDNPQPSMQNVQQGMMTPAEKYNLKSLTPEVNVFLFDSSKHDSCCFDAVYHSKSL